jgi:serine/threonine-protein kinase
VRDVGAALAAAHGAGIVHRDVKPENVVLRRTSGGEEVKLVDFGIAKTHELTESVGDHLTRTGAVLGTPAYMAPERWRGRPCDASADVWALGVLAYQLISGQLPYVGSGSEIAIDVTREAPRTLMEVDGRIPKPVSDAVMSALTIKKESRPSALDFGTRLLDAVMDLPAAVQSEACGRAAPGGADADTLVETTAS